MYFQNTKKLSGEKGPLFFCVPRVSKTLGSFNFYFLKLFYVLKSNENKENRKNAFDSRFFILKTLKT